jgi:hypothetical protein
LLSSAHSILCFFVSSSIIHRLPAHNATFLLLPIFSAAILGWSHTTAQFLTSVTGTTIYKVNLSLKLLKQMSARAKTYIFAELFMNFLMNEKI